MYLTIIFLPLLSAIISGFTARSIGIKGSKILSCLIIIFTAILATISFYEVGFNASTCLIILFNWLDSESLQLSWSFQLDSLTVSMLIPVIYVSSCVHLYSIVYMANDPAKCIRETLQWGKLSNSGDILKLMVPSHNRKVVSGQNNYLGMVTSHKMMETEMDYRGSKSKFKLDFVKEQRADGS